MTKLWTHGQAAEFLGVSESTLSAMRKAGEIPFLRLRDSRKGIRFSLGSLDKWLAKRQKLSGGPQARQGGA